jgi:glyoxylase-like metal-dependent hydrolase (beta-lactamase superfamily II)
MAETAGKILKLSLPTPYPVGDINAYFVDGPAPALVDAGLFYKKSLKAMEDQLQTIGRSAKDIRRIFITHEHIDHIGAALYLSQECGAVLFCHEKSEIFEPWAEEPRMKLYDFLLRCGSSREILDQNLEAFKFAQKFINTDAKPFRVERLKGGETVAAGDLRLEAVATPGHSPDHLCYFDRESKSLFCGDLLLGEITPNPLINLDPNDDYRHAPSLVSYMDSLGKVNALNPSTAYPGHGPVISDVPGLIQTNLKFIDERKNIFLSKIRAGLKTPYELAQSLFGNLDAMNQLLGMSEAVAYLDLLERDKKIVVDWEGKAVSFRLTNG